MLVLCIGSLLMASTASASTEPQRVGKWGLKIAPLITELGRIDKQVGRDLSDKGTSRIDEDAVKLTALVPKFRGLEKAPLLTLSLIAAKMSSDVVAQAADLRHYSATNSLAPLENFVKRAKDTAKENQNLVTLLKTYSAVLS
jgi:hypothetical protein